MNFGWETIGLPSHLIPFPMYFQRGILGVSQILFFFLPFYACLISGYGGPSFCLNDSSHFISWPNIQNPVRTNIPSTVLTLCVCVCVCVCVCICVHRKEGVKPPGEHCCLDNVHCLPRCSWEACKLTCIGLWQAWLLQGRPPKSGGFDGAWLAPHLGSPFFQQRSDWHLRPRWVFPEHIYIF